MCNLLWLSIWLLLPAVLGENDNGADVTTTTGQKSGVNSNSSDLLPSAERLIRYRRHPPYHVRTISSKRSKQRRRIKNHGPKTRYGPPSYASGPPLSYYKPSPSFPEHLDEPSFSLDDFQHLKFDGADFELPATSYEAQSMDLDLYGHNQDLYGAHKFPSLEYSFTGGHDTPSLSSFDHKPHQKYGVPPLHQSIPSNSYEAIDSYPPQHYEPPAPRPPPSTIYGVPELPVHVPPSYTHSDPSPSAPDSYSIYEQKIPNAGYHQNFAEPPTQGPSTHSANFEISHSPPAYEISTSYQANEPQYDNKYQPQPSSDHGYQPPAGHEYQPGPLPSQHGYQSPVKHSYQPPAPDHSYQPSNPDNYQPPHQPSIGDNYHQPPPPPPQQQHPSSSFSQQDTHQSVQSYPQENYSPPSEELPLSHNHKFPSFDFPKSSYEVPIYDPIPFESTNKEEQESYPPILSDESSSSNELPSDDAHPAGSSRAPTKSRKRKRRPSASVLAKKHVLDVPELQEAYDANSHVHVRGTDLDTAAHGSRYVEQKRKFSSYTTPPTTTTTTASPWSPMRQRTTASNSFQPTIVTSTPPTTVRSRSRGTSRYRNRNPTTEAASTVVTIEKSRSQSYYDGTIAPPTYQQFPVHSVRSSRPTRPPQVRSGAAATLALLPYTERNPTLKRTTKGIFDTTLFKSPQSDREMERKLHAFRQNLPKNHKLY